VRHLPTFVSVEPANFCQLRCPECPVGIASSPNRLSPNRLMPLSIFERVLEQVQATAHTMQFYFQGEPLLNKQLPEMIAAAHKLGLYTIVSTNAQALNRSIAEALVKSGLNRIIVSIDGFSEESYATYRVGGSLHKALEGLQLLANAKAEFHSRIRIELQVLRLRSNEHEWRWIKKNYESLGATRLVFKTAQLYNFEHGHPLMPTDERYSRYRKTADGTYVHKKASRLSPYCLFASSPCKRLWSGCVITTNGDVLPCCYDKNHRYTYGNITQESLAELYHSTKTNALRRRVLLYQGEPLEMCKNCNQ
jgi:radical SAM protein with 4Fe4S-binding SPASM domain